MSVVYIQFVFCGEPFGRSHVVAEFSFMSITSDVQSRRGNCFAKWVQAIQELAHSFSRVLCFIDIRLEPIASCCKTYL